MFPNYFERRKTRKAFEKLVNPKTVENLLPRKRSEFSQLKPARIEFVIACVRGDSPQQISARVGTTVDIAFSKNSQVLHIMGPFVAILFGTSSETMPHPESRKGLVDSLAGALAKDVKIVHGASDGHYGLIGSESLSTYGVLIPQFDGIVGKLCALEFGTIMEMT